MTLFSAIAYNRVMPRRTERSVIVDSLLRTIALGSITAAALLAPGAAVALDKPLNNYLNKLDKKEREEELRRLLRYVRGQGLITSQYQHGLKLTAKAMARLDKVDIESIKVSIPKKWDGLWRIVFYDIPEYKKAGRDALSLKLKQLGFYQLQRSVWLYPHPCEDELSAIALAYGIHSYLTLVTATSIQNQARLQNIFSDII